MNIAIKEFIGHWHPVVVHLPIGILLLSVVLMWAARKRKNGRDAQGHQYFPIAGDDQRFTGLHHRVYVEYK